MAVLDAEQIEGTIYSRSLLGSSTVKFWRTGESVASGTLPASANALLTLTLTFSRHVRVIPLASFAFYVDNDGNSAYLWPDGASLTAASTPRVEWIYSLANSNPKQGIYVWKVRVKNTDTVAHTLYAYSEAYAYLPT